VEETKGTIAANAFRPEKYTDPKGGRLFTLLPVYSFQARHIRIDAPTFGRILVDAGLERRATANEEQIYQRYWQNFDMARIGIRDFASLRTNSLQFW
jgi:hypothetical protein